MTCWDSMENNNKSNGIRNVNGPNLVMEQAEIWGWVKRCHV